MPPSPQWHLIYLGMILDGWPFSRPSGFVKPSFFSFFFFTYMEQQRFFFLEEYVENLVWTYSLVAVYTWRSQHETFCWRCNFTAGKAAHRSAEKEKVKQHIVPSCTLKHYDIPSRKLSTKQDTLLECTTNQFIRAFYTVAVKCPVLCCPQRWFGKLNASLSHRLAPG